MCSGRGAQQHGTCRCKDMTRWCTMARHKATWGCVSIVTSCPCHTSLGSSCRCCQWWGHGGPLRERVCPSARMLIECGDWAEKEEVSNKTNKEKTYQQTSRG